MVDLSDSKEAELCAEFLLIVFLGPPAIPLTIPYPTDIIHPVLTKETRYKDKSLRG